MTLLVQREHAAVLSQRPLEEAGPHRFTVEEYLRLSELGFFDGRRVEFIDGEILDVASQKDPHTLGVTHTTYWCVGAFPRDRFWVRIQSTLLTAGSAPDPDFVVLDGPPAATADGYPSADRAVLVMEVADSTLLYDTTTKMSLYASAGVKDYWVLSIPDRVLIVHRQPIRAAATRHGFAYAEVRRFAAGEPVSPLAMPTAVVDPAQILP
jgi:Uma2 family endonuclease